VKSCAIFAPASRPRAKSRDRPVEGDAIDRRADDAAQSRRLPPRFRYGAPQPRALADTDSAFDVGDARPARRAITLRNAPEAKFRVSGLVREARPRRPMFAGSRAYVAPAGQSRDRGRKPTQWTAVSAALPGAAAAVAAAIRLGPVIGSGAFRHGGGALGGRRNGLRGRRPRRGWRGRDLAVRPVAGADRAFGVGEADPSRAASPDVAGRELMARPWTWIRPAQ